MLGERVLRAPKRRNPLKGQYKRGLEKWGRGKYLGPGRGWMPIRGGLFKKGVVGGTLGGK